MSSQEPSKSDVDTILKRVRALSSNKVKFFVVIFLFV